MASRAERAAWEAASGVWTLTPAGPGHSAVDAAVAAVMALIGSEECRAAVGRAVAANEYGVALAESPVPRVDGRSYGRAIVATEALVAWLGEEAE